MTEPMTEMEIAQMAHFLKSAVACLQDIAALKGTSKRQETPSEIAIDWLLSHGYPPDRNGPGYVPGKGFTDETK